MCTLWEPHITDPDFGTEKGAGQSGWRINFGKVCFPNLVQLWKARHCSCLYTIPSCSCCLGLSSSASRGHKKYISIRLGPASYLSMERSDFCDQFVGGAHINILRSCKCCPVNQSNRSQAAGIVGAYVDKSVLIRCGYLDNTMGGLSFLFTCCVTVVDTRLTIA